MSISTKTTLELLEEARHALLQAQRFLSSAFQTGAALKDYEDGIQYEQKKIGQVMSYIQELKNGIREN